MLKLRMAAPLLMAVLVSTSILSQALSTSQHASVFGSSSATLPAVTLTRSSSRKLAASLPVVDVPLYLIPTRQSSLCTDGNCCNSDYRASPYTIRFLNSTSTTVAQQQLTTFYWTLQNQQPCSGDCCKSNVSKIWIDVDPKVQVQYVSFNGDTANFATQQDQYGFHIIPYSGLLTTIPTDGALLTVTVTGVVSQLCPVPDYMLGVPVNGTCQVILLGSTPDGSSTCCPHALTRARSRFSNFQPAPPQCIQAIDSSPFDLSLSSVGLPYASGSSLIANYSFTLSADAASCNAADINTCCGMGLDSITFSLAPGVTVLSTQLGGKPATVTLPTAQAPSLTLQQLGLSSATLPRSGVSIILTVQLPTGSSQVPDICQSTPSADGSVGHCTFTFTSATGASMCCPSSATTALIPGTAAPSPIPTPTPSPTPTPTPTPSPNPDTCNPTLAVPLKDTSMGFNYYNGPLPASPSSTSFQFTVYNNAQCNKPYCQDVCSWTLLLNPQLSGLLSFSTDSPSDNGTPVLAAAGTSVTFYSAPPHAGTLLYTLVVAQAGVTLEQLCSGSATPGQANACTAIIRNPTVLSTVQFGQQDILVPGSSPPSSPAPGPGPAAACTNGKALSSSCLRVDAATFNSPAGATSTVLDFNVVNHDGEQGCTPDDAVMTFKVLLADGVVTELRGSQAIVPSTAQFASDGSSITWTWSPVQAGQSLHYQLDVASSASSVSSICAQGVLPAQPAGSCAVVFTGATTCYMGFVPVAYDPNLQPLPVAQASSSSSSKDLASIVAPAIIVPLAVLAAVLAALYFMVYRRRRAAGGAGGQPRAVPDQADELVAPLATHEPSASNMSRTSGSVASERSGSDVQIQLPSESAALR